MPGASASPELSAGVEFAGYRIEAVIGRGGMGVVYRATDIELESEVALKVIAPELLADDDFRERFRRERRMAASIRHPHVVRVYHAGEQDGRLYVAMDYVQGSDLDAMIKTRGRLESSLAAEIVHQVSGALDAAHAAGLVHRDVKPANVLIESEHGAMHAYLTDFGLTRRLDSSTKMTATGMLVGTVDYMAPEQMRGAPVDARTDVYALGCVLYRALSGRVPYPRDEVVAAIYAHANDPVPSLRKLAPDVPEEFDAVVAKAMAKSPDERYLSAGDLGRAALAAARGQSVHRAERSVASGEAAPLATTVIASGVAADGATITPDTTELATPDTAIAAEPARRRRVAALAVAVAIIAAIVAIVIGSGGSKTAHRRPATTHSSNASSPPTNGVRVGRNPGAITGAQGSIWIANRADGTITRANARFGQVIGQPIKAGADPVAIAGGYCCVWVASDIDGTVTRIDASTGQVIGDPVKQSDVRVLAVGQNAVWLASMSGSKATLSRIDRVTGKAIGSPIQVGSGVGPLPTGIAVDQGVVWVVTQYDRSVTRIDEKTGKVIGHPITVGRDPGDIAVGSGSAWVVNHTDRTVTRIDASSGRVIGKPIPTGASPEGICVGAGSVWVANSEDNTVTRINATSGQVAGDPIKVGRGPFGMEGGPNTIWVTNSQDNTATLIDPSNNKVVNLK